MSITAAQIAPVLADVRSALTTLGPLGQLKGTNLSGAEFGAGVIPGVLNNNYTFPTLAELVYYSGKGMNIVRLPFLWERIQPVLGGPLDSSHVSWLTGFAQYSPNVIILFDVHSYGGYNGKLIGAAGGPTQAQFANLWNQIATAFPSSTFPNAWFGLMNEPSAISASSWLQTVNIAIAAIRATGAKNTVTVPGLSFTGAWTWLSSGNSVNMLGVVDPSNNWIYEAHQYLDSDGSGESATAVSATILSQRLTAMTAWLRNNGFRCILGEFGAANNPTMLSALTDGVSYMQANADVWAAWTYWSGGPWWGTYIYSIEPTNLGQPTQTDSAQMTALLPYL
jgi:endoglucanase